MRTRGGQVSGVVLLASVAVAALTATLTACAPDPEVSTVVLALARVQSCSLGTADRLTLRALGDFPAQQVTLDPAQPSITLDQFPFDARELRFDALFPTRRAAALVTLELGSDPTPVLLLPETRSCPLGDPLALALPGAAVAALPHGLLIAGGRGAQGLAESSAVVLPSGAELVQQVPDGMLLRRAFATAIVAADSVIVAGGVADDDGSAHDTYEVFDPVLGHFARERSQKLVTGPRMQHAAARLPDGRVLLVGGHADATGPALASAELIDLATGERSETRGASVVARIAPSVLVLDTGAVLVLGGRDDHGEVIDSVERFDPRTLRFSFEDVALPTHTDTAFAALPGGRVAVLSCAAFDECVLTLLLDRARVLTQEGVAIDFLSQLPDGLEAVRLLALDDGRLLVTGQDPGAVIARRAFVIDLGEAPRLEAHDASRVPTELVRLHDGVIAELDVFGASLRRETTRSAFETPKGNVIDEDAAFATLDAPSHWRRESLGLRAQVAGARIDLAALRFADSRITLAADGGVTLLLRDASGAELSVQLDGDKLEGCAGSLGKDGSLIVLRRSKQLELRSNTGKTLCTRKLSTQPISLALRADRGTLLRELRVERL